jgi:TPR repeat protein
MARYQSAAHEFVEHANQAGASDDLFELGLQYCVGRDVEVDLVIAHKWFNLAAIRGNEEARQYRTQIAQEMTKPQIATAQKLAREWLSRH